jgi:hypothetical protein
VFLLNSRSSLVTATPRKERRCSRLPRGHPFSQSYGVRLPSSLTIVLSRAWVSSTRLPVSVCGTVGGFLARGFSGHLSSPVRVRCYPFASLFAACMCPTDLPIGPGYRKDPDFLPRAVTFQMRPPFAHNGTHRSRNVDRAAIAYPARVRLRTD